MLNALSVDVEDWFQVGAFENVIAREDWEGLEQRVEANADSVLALFDEAGVKATFFTLGWVAERHPALMRRIVTAGHEIASHGWDHKRVFTLGPEEFRSDLRRASQAIEKSCRMKPIGYRAPSFSIDSRTPWAHSILAEEGYLYSSSVAPLAHDHYGWPDAPRFAFHPLAGSDLIELPVTTVELARRRFAAGGGGFFRLLPYRFSDWAIGRVNREGRPAIFYFHPWEVDPGQPRVKNAPLKSRLRHYSRLSSMRPRLLKLFKGHRWGTTGEVAGLERARLK
jgi:polysaccharide deacetylase family protein (PEP-CTERM system associated)